MGCKHYMYTGCQRRLPLTMTYLWIPWKWMSSQTLTVLPICWNLKSSVADTVEAAFSVYTAAIVADATIGHTLIQICQRQTDCKQVQGLQVWGCEGVSVRVWVGVGVCMWVGGCGCETSTLCPGCSALESSRTLTDVRPRGVHTLSMCTWISFTFIIIWKANKRGSDTSIGLMSLKLSAHKKRKTQLTKALSSSIQPESHVALAAISDPSGHWDTPAIQTEVAVGLAHVGDVLGKRTWAK